VIELLFGVVSEVMLRNSVLGAGPYRLWVGKMQFWGI